MELVQRLHWRLGLARRSRIARVIFRQIGIISTRRKIGHLNYIIDYGKKGEFLKSLINFSWNNSLYVSTRVFDLEIGN
jgi:hypothetical protein